MIRVRRPPIAQVLTPAERARLARKQADVNGYVSGDGRIKRAWNNFRRTKTGKAVYQALKKVFRSKCAFCERVNARTADHFYPRQLYPRRMFRWQNLLLCCGECNPLKGSFFPFLNRRPVLVDPTSEDPADYISWDFDTGAVVVSADPMRQPRAVAMRDRLKLDEGPLRDERRAHLKTVVYLLLQVLKEHPAISLATRNLLAEQLHPDRPYRGILRALFCEPNEYRPIVDAARAKLPEIDDWTAEWL
jgi:uncharacterized protein (TIGR02646 family)